MFGGLDAKSRFRDEFFFLQYVRRLFGSTNFGTPDTTSRERSAFMRKMHPVIEEVKVNEDDDLSLATEESLVFQSKEVSEAAIVDVRFPDTVGTFVVPRLPHLVRSVGYENVFNVEGASLADINRAQQRSMEE